jgi:hypothetical protein
MFAGPLYQFAVFRVACPVCYPVIREASMILVHGVWYSGHDVLWWLVKAGVVGVAFILCVFVSLLLTDHILRGSCGRNSKWQH